MYLVSINRIFYI